ncbi:MAG: dihydrofolate reductase [Bacteroidota bacterium]|nr:dihydrofolate reductase [Bacteroidota bacterium]
MNIVAALTPSRVIGKGGKLPWHIPEDLKRFRQLTTGHCVVMGRKTYEAIGKPLPNRRNVVVTSRSIPGIETYGSLDTAFAALSDVEEVFVIGGGKIYAQTLGKASKLYLTIVHQNVEGDTFFPPYEELVSTSFKLINEEKHEGFVFRDYERIPDKEKHPL